jgi:prophage DNA circulation protein
MDIQSLYSTLLTATFGGVPFYVVDTSQEVGRRVQRFLYPGLDDASFQDLGADDGPIALRGLLVGDDYIAQTRVLRGVFRSAGPYTLVHPWLGSFQVVLAPGQRPRITLAANELRVARFEVQVLPYVASQQPGLDTLSQLETSLDAVTADAQNWLANAMSPLVNALGAFGYVQNYLQTAATVFSAAIAAVPGSATEIAAAASASLALLAAPTTAPSAGWAVMTAAQLVAVPVAMAGACTPALPAAVAAGGITTPATPADPADTVAALLAAIPGIAASTSSAAPAPAIAAGMQAVIIAQAVAAAANIIYDSQQAAEAQAAILYAAIDAAVAAAATAAQTDPANAAPVWRDLVGLKAALAADLNALIGRLPAVVTIHIATASNAWLLAQYISGDNPADVYATYQDLIARNDIFHPALVPPGAIEVLNN